MAKNVLVTGGSGRLGNYVCSYLKKQGFNVTSFDVVPTPPESFNAVEQIPFVMGDLLNLGEFLRAIAVAKADVIVHLAAITGPTEISLPYDKEKGFLGGPPMRYMQRVPEDTCFKINTMGTFYILDAARRMGVKDVIISSSFFATGMGNRPGGSSYTPQYLPVDEEHPCDPENSYSLSKYLNEITGEAFARAYNMNVIALRYMGVHYDNNKNSQHKFGITIEQLEDVNKGKMTLTSCQYADARDIARIIEMGIQKMGSPDLKPFEAFFVSTDTKYVGPSSVDVAKAWPFLSELAKNLKGNEGIFSIAKAEKLLGYKPAYSWRDSK